MSNKVIDAAIREFDSSSAPISLQDGAVINNQPAEASANLGDVTVTVQGTVTLQLNGYTLNSLTVSTTAADSHILVIHGAVRGPIEVIGATEGTTDPILPERVILRDIRVVSGTIKVRSSHDAMFDAVSVSRTSSAPIDVEVGQNVIAHSLHVTDCWLPTTPDPATAFRLVGGGTIELRSLEARSLSTFAQRLRCVYLEGDRVYAGNINIERASAPRGQVDGVVPVSNTTPAILGDVRVDAHSGGESDELELTAPGGGTMVTACVGHGISRPVVAATNTRTHGAVDAHFRHDQAAGGQEEEEEKKEDGEEEMDETTA